MPERRHYFDSMIASAKTGAPWAWEALYREYAPAVAGYVRGRGAPDVEDAVSETFLSVAKDIHRFSGDQDDFRAWLFTIAHHRVADEFRKAGRQVARADAADPTDVAADQWLGNVEHEAMSNLSMIEVSTIIRSLTARQRDVLLLRVVGDLSVAETARVLETSEGAVKATQSKALKAIRERLTRASSRTDDGDGDGG